MKNQVDVTVNMSFDIQDGIPQDEMEGQINYWIDETMSLMDDAEGKYEFIDGSTVLRSINGQAKLRYWLLGEEVTDCYFECDTIEEVKACLAEHGGSTYCWDGNDVNELLSAVDGWMGFAEITEEEYDDLQSDILPI